MKKIFLAILSIFLLCGCEYKSQNEINEENIQKCLNRGGSPVAHYCAGGSYIICSVDCFYDKED